GELNRYIRFGNSHTDVIAENLHELAANRSFTLKLATSTMAYNIFDLVRIRDWWSSLAERHETVSGAFNFASVVLAPAWLNPRVLSDSVRAKAAARLEAAMIKTEFVPVIDNLRQPYLGDELHNRFVRYTRTMESMRGNRIDRLVPELAAELDRRESHVSAV